jgi:predicted Rossmann fold flavoprotein
MDPLMDQSLRAIGRTGRCQAGASIAAPPCPARQRLRYNHAMEKFDIAVIGAGAAGMMCAAVAARTGRRVVLLDHADKIGEKIRISGGGRCNFTNIHASPAQYLSDNPHFCRSALARYTPKDFIHLLESYGVRWHEKHRGQLFCSDSSDAVVNVLRAECDAARVVLRHPVQVLDIARRGQVPDGGVTPERGPERGPDERFVLSTDHGKMAVNAVVVATGGLPVPKIGATDFAMRFATRWGIPVIAPQAALVPLTFSAQEWAPFADLAGVSLEVGISTGTGKARGAFVEDLLLTHRGLSGPAVLQISSYWTPPAPIEIDLLPGRDAVAELLAAKSGSRRQLVNLLAEWLPSRLATTWVSVAGVAPDVRLADLPDRVVRALGTTLNGWRLHPAGTEGWRKAEVMRGGVDTRALSSATMEVKACPGLYFIGEAVDVTGWLGGYNFQWAWASGVAAGMAAASEMGR